MGDSIYDCTEKVFKSYPYLQDRLLSVYAVIQSNVIVMGRSFLIVLP